MFNTDKIEPHRYFQTYVQLAGELGPHADVLEIGVLGGESLKMWQAFYPLGTVTGVDIADGAGWPEGTIKIVGDATSPMTASRCPGPYHLIIDDGSHAGEQVKKSFSIFWPKVAPGGYYVVEDWQVSVRDAWRPGETWGATWGPGMLEAVQSMLPLLNDQEAECESITYRWGMCIIHKRA